MHGIDLFIFFEAEHVGMGWFTSVIVQAVVTSVVLGALKRAGIVR